ncbi:hypothetical protein PLICRDRAFT_40830 [Plicaturopsis crispa FD-325 SS-3]|nr:hypothetical protein PLICRDRAFT_40830 [Plicaturopsis crispa FD-325 SS-3]
MSVLSLRAAHSLAALFATGYVGSIYLFKNARVTYYDGRQRKRLDGTVVPPKDRDDPSVIKARLLAVSIATAAAITTVSYVCLRAGNDGASRPDPIDVLALRPSRSPYPHFLAPLLFLGPVSQELLNPHSEWGYWSWRWGRDAGRILTGQFAWKGMNWITMRNYVVAPLTEELLFRSCVLAVYVLARGGSDKRGIGSLIGFSPVWFGFAHIHHAYDTWRRLGRTRPALQRAIIGSLFQFAYTTLFGAYAAFLLLRTRSVWPAVSAHIWCNLWGLPAPDFRREHGAFIAIAYVAGIVSFAYTLGPWTAS